MKTALLIIDMINGLEFPEGKMLKRAAEPVAENILRLKKKLKKKRVPVIYVNDNFGQWRSNWKEVFDYCARVESLGSKISNTLKPDDDDFFILKPKHSAFFASNLELLLDELKVKKLIVTGIAGNICVLFTVNDAHMRGYEIHVPQDCIALNRKADTNYTLRQLSEVFSIKTGSLL